MALPVLRAIRRARPKDGLAVLAGRGAATLFRAEGSADAVLERSGLFGDARGLAAGRFAEAWLLPNSFRSALAPRLAGIPERIGYDTDRRRRLLTQALPPRRRLERFGANASGRRGRRPGRCLLRSDRPWPHRSVGRSFEDPRPLCLLLALLPEGLPLRTRVHEGDNGRDGLRGGKGADRLLIED